MSSVLRKWNVFSSLLTLSLPLVCHGQVVIYGLDNARHFDSHRSGPYFIQIGSFQSKSFALQLKQKVERTSSYHVIVAQSGTNHAVRIGPLTSVAEVHSVSNGQRLSTTMQKPTQHHMPLKQQPRMNQQAPIKVRNLPAYPPPRPLPIAVSNQNSNWYVGVNVGTAHGTNHQAAMTVHNGSDYPPPENLDQYTVDNQASPAMVDIQAGRRWQNGQPFLPAYSLGLRYQHLTTQHVEGNVIQYSLPEFLNYNYKWGVGADALSLYSKVDIAQFARLMPYVDVGVGLSKINSSAYTETPLPEVTPRISPDYASGSNVHFTYNLGAGLDFIITPRLLLSAGYQYQSFGNLTSGQGQGDHWQSERLSLGNMNSNIGLLGLTYLIDVPTQMPIGSYK